MVILELSATKASTPNTLSDPSRELETNTSNSDDPEHRDFTSAILKLDEKGFLYDSYISKSLGELETQNNCSAPTSNILASNQSIRDALPEAEQHITTGVFSYMQPFDVLETKSSPVRQRRNSKEIISTSGQPNPALKPMAQRRQLGRVMDLKTSISPEPSSVNSRKHPDLYMDAYTQSIMPIPTNAQLDPSFLAQEHHNLPSMTHDIKGHQIMDQSSMYSAPQRSANVQYSIARATANNESPILSKNESLEFHMDTHPLGASVPYMAPVQLLQCNYEYQPSINYYPSLTNMVPMAHTSGMHGEMHNLAGSPASDRPLFSNQMPVGSPMLHPYLNSRDGAHSAVVPNIPGVFNSYQDNSHGLIFKAPQLKTLQSNNPMIQLPLQSNNPCPPSIPASGALSVLQPDIPPSSMFSRSYTPIQPMKQKISPLSKAPQSMHAGHVLPRSPVTSNEFIYKNVTTYATINQRVNAIGERYKKKRETHNAIERRRRDLINERITELSGLVPQCQEVISHALNLAKDQEGSKKNGQGTPITTPEGVEQSQDESNSLNTIGSTALPTPECGPECVLTTIATGATLPRSSIQSRICLQHSRPRTPIDSQSVLISENNPGFSTTVRLNKTFVLEKSAEYIRQLQDALGRQAELLKRATNALAAGQPDCADKNLQGPAEASTNSETDSDTTHSAKSNITDNDQ